VEEKEGEEEGSGGEDEDRDGDLMIQSLLEGAKLRKKKLMKVMLRWKQ
jgi:hypothetical protein